MLDLSAFLITQRWPAKHPDRLQLYSLPTPNGVKVSIMLEEIGLPHEVHLVDFNENDQHTPEFLSLNPNGKIPAILHDEYTIADISMLGWVRNLIGFYEAREPVEFDSFREVPAWFERGLARRAVQCGLTTPRRP
jgi:glutathione S-transferase